MSLPRLSWLRRPLQSASPAPPSHPSPSLAAARGYDLVPGFGRIKSKSWHEARSEVAASNNNSVFWELIGI